MIICCCKLGRMHKDNGFSFSPSVVLRTANAAFTIHWNSSGNVFDESYCSSLDCFSLVYLILPVGIPYSRGKF